MGHTFFTIQILTWMLKNSYNIENKTQMKMVFMEVIFKKQIKLKNQKGYQTTL